MRSIRVFAKNLSDPYYEPTIVVHDTQTLNCSQKKNFAYRIRCTDCLYCSQGY